MIKKISKFQLLKSFSIALDIAERRYISHSKHVAYLSYKIGEVLGLSKSQLYSLFSASILHDIGVSELNLDEIEPGEKLKAHCVKGAKIVEKLPFDSKLSEIILYHHEHYDGTGIFKIGNEEIPLLSRIIYIADQFDIRFSSKCSDYYKTRMDTLEWIEENKNTKFDPKICEAMVKVIDKESFWLDYVWSDFNNILERNIQDELVYLTIEQITTFAEIFASIIDNRSPFTYRHSKGLAKKVKYVIKSYGYKAEYQEAIYIAGLLHDVGKLAVPNRILDKQGPLTLEERAIINTHSYYTHMILSQLPEFEYIVKWASNHHEKIDGTGYPNRKTGKELSFFEKVMGICDVYQALVEERPYRTSMTHDEAFNIIKKLANEGKFDIELVEDLHLILKTYSEIMNEDDEKCTNV